MWRETSNILSVAAIAISSRQLRVCHNSDAFFRLQEKQIRVEREDAALLIRSCHFLNWRCRRRRLMSASSTSSASCCCSIFVIFLGALPDDDL
jgi:hypothetical protein